MSELADFETFEFDIAFSFLDRDEGLATQISDLLGDRYRTFVYSEHQAELAGTDGEKTLNSVFGAKARTVAVLYRPEWGTTKWTRIEDTAIRNRALEHGYDFATFLLLDESSKSPRWVPKTQLYYNLPRFGVEGAAAALALRIQNHGGEPTVESVADRAKRLKRAQDLQELRKRFETSYEGVAAAEEERRSFFDGPKVAADEITAAGAICRVRDIAGFTLLIGKGVVLLAWWQRHFANSLDGAKLVIDFYDGVPKLPGLMVSDDPRRLEKNEFKCSLVAPDQIAWIDKNKKTYSSAQLIDQILKRFMDFQESGH